MKPIEYREIDNPASLLEKLNEIVDEINLVHTRLDAIREQGQLNATDRAQAPVKDNSHTNTK